MLEKLNKKMFRVAVLLLLGGIVWVRASQAREQQLLDKAAIARLQGERLLTKGVRVLDALSVAEQTAVAETITQFFKGTTTTITQIHIYQDDYGPVVSLELSTPHVENANSFVNEMIMDIDNLFNGFTLQRRLAEIGVLKLWLLDNNGTVLLAYVRDYQLNKESWWEHEDLDAGWYPQPPPTLLEELFGR